MVWDTTVSHVLPMKMECAAADVSVTLSRTNKLRTKGATNPSHKENTEKN